MEPYEIIKFTTVLIVVNLFHCHLTEASSSSSVLSINGFPNVSEKLGNLSSDHHYDVSMLWLYFYLLHGKKCNDIVYKTFCLRIFQILCWSIML